MDQKYITRFISRIDTALGSNGCWLWTGPKDKKYGYGKYRENTKNHKAHRLMWELSNGPIPNGMCVCHHCDNPPCCNPSHLFLGTHLDNAIDSKNKGRRATGDKNGSRAHPEKLLRGEKHYSKIHPEKVARGAMIWTNFLTESQVVEIRKMKETGMTCSFLAKLFNCSKSNIKAIARRITWKHIQ